MASPPPVGFLPQGYLAPVRSEILVEKLRRHFTEAFAGDALEQVMTASYMVDEWVWTNSAPEDQAADLEKLKNKYTHGEGDTARARTRFLERELEAKKVQIHEEYVLDITHVAHCERRAAAWGQAAKKAKKAEMDAMAKHPGSSSAAAWVAEGCGGQLRPPVAGPQPQAQRTSTGRTPEVLYGDHGEVLGQLLTAEEYFFKRNPGKTMEDFEKLVGLRPSGP
jgi:hypothetical protein